MAAFCACCGAEITPKAEACTVCGTPQHGSLPVYLQETLSGRKALSAGPGDKTSCERAHVSGDPDRS
jgi:predicted amidophosphoribosyltransferase